jgi:tetratricopeptide (TPR) repeat protein
VASHLRTLGMALAVCITHAAGAEPFVPAHDDVVLERLPDAGDPTARQLRQAQQREPESLDRALALAWHWVRQARASADPRAAGWAEGVLAPWLALPEPPSEALLLRATVRQNRHEFGPALSDLGLVLSRDPRNAQAWLTRATILQVQGRPREAEQACLRLLPLADSLVASTCLANAAGLAGRGAAALTLLERALADEGEAAPGLRVWALTSRAELAARLGRAAEAEEAYRAALDLDARDPYLLAAWADFLLAGGRAGEVRALLEGALHVDGLLLRLALAERALEDSRADEHIELLRSRFAALRARGDSAHLGEEARFALTLGADVEAAVELASANFALQREPRDALVLLESALAARQPEAASPALAWLGRTGLEDSRLSQLARRIEALR